MMNYLLIQCGFNSSFSHFHYQLSYHGKLLYRCTTVPKEEEYFVRPVRNANLKQGGITVNCEQVQQTLRKNTLTGKSRRQCFSLEDCNRELSDNHHAALYNLYTIEKTPGNDGIFIRIQ